MTRVVWSLFLFFNFCLSAEAAAVGSEVGRSLVEKAEQKAKSSIEFEQKRKLVDQLKSDLQKALPKGSGAAVAKKRLETDVIQYQEALRPLFERPELIKSESDCEVLKAQIEANFQGSGTSSQAATSSGASADAPPELPKFVQHSLSFVGTLCR